MSRKRKFTFRTFVFNCIMHHKLLAFVDDLYEDLELWYPKLRLEEAGCSTTVAALEIKN
jgi:hypothetical protein